MLLKKFRVMNFRSIIDSGWVNCEDLTTIVGVNEAGKSNLLLALSRLSPSFTQEIRFMRDLPRSLYAQMRESCKDAAFVEALFEIGADSPLLAKLKVLTQAEETELRQIVVSRLYNGEFAYFFPNERQLKEEDLDGLKAALMDNIRDVEEIVPSGDAEFQYKNTVIDILRGAMLELSAIDVLDSDFFDRLLEKCRLGDQPSEPSEIALIFAMSLQSIRSYQKLLNKPPLKSGAVWKALRQALPVFVYYSHYGNLDSEIYLPHVVENLSRTNLSGPVAAKAKTLRVLFDFIKIDPAEILELSADGPLDKDGRPLENPTAAQMKKYMARKDERGILLQAASDQLTREFSSWWNQGKYTFELKADGRYFRILVSDEKRPERVELESRSTGLQWFVSFYLTFFVHAKEHMNNAVLLLDEAGLSLHPMAQRDLLLFLDNLSHDNQIIHTTHSPFLVDTKRLHRTKVAYVDRNGYTVAADTLFAGSDSRRSASLYTIYAAIGLNVSDALLPGCSPVIVADAAAQHYLNAIRNHMALGGKLIPKNELVFIPGGRAEGIEAIARVVSSKEKGLPVVLLSSDASGEADRARLLRGLYRGRPERVIALAEIMDKQGAEIEELIPLPLFEAPVNRLFKELDEAYFWDGFNSQEKILPQIRALADDYQVILADNFREELARLVRLRLSRAPGLAKTMEYTWTKLLNKMNF